MKKATIVFLILIAFAVSVLAQTASPQEKTATVFGVKLRYLEAGDPAKPKVVLLHGLGGQAENWQFVIPALAQKFHVIVPDHVGFGKSDKPPIKYRIGTYADFLDKLLSELKIEKATLVGNSMGGWVAGFYAVKYPARVEKLVLVNAAGLTPDVIDYSRIYQLNSSTRDEVRANLKLIFYNQAYAANEALIDTFLTQRVTAGDGDTVNSIIESIKRGEDFIDKSLSSIKQPTLIVWGKQDGLIPVADAEKFNKGIAGSKLVVFDQCGHVPQVEKAVDFTRELITFLEAK